MDRMKTLRLKISDLEFQISDFRFLNAVILTILPAFILSIL
jgi:hypothetical protein